MKSLILLLLCTSLLAEETPKKEEDKLIISTVKQKEIDKQLSSNPELKACKDKKDIADKDKCISDLISGMDEKQLEAIAKDIGGSAYEVDGGAKSESIKNFMQDRIQNIIYGDKKKRKKSGPAKVVGHSTYRDIYKSQLGKNMFLDINTYCLENLGFSGASNKLKTIQSANFEVKDGVKTIKTVQIGTAKEDGIKSVSSVSDAHSFWNSLTEYTKGTKAEGDKSTGTKRSLEQLQLLKKASLSNYQVTPQEAQSANSFCSSVVIEGMCTMYKCSTTDKADLSSDEEKECREVYNVTLNDTGSTTIKRGQIACGLVSRLEAYKKTFKAIDKQKSEMAKLKGGAGYGSALEAINTQYGDIDKMTSVSSKELTNEATALKELDDKAKELEEECMKDSSSDLCTKAIEVVSDDEAQNINLENKIATAVYKERLSKLGKKGDPKEFEKFLKENGLFDKYGKALENADAGAMEDLSKLVANDYKSKKDALTQTMMDKYNAAAGKKKIVAGAAPVELTDTKKEEKIKEKANELKEEKSYIETMYEYNNIVTSYLNLKEESKEGDRTVTKNVGSFDQNRKNELEALKKYAGNDPKALEDYNKYKKMFSDSDKGSGSSGKSVDDINFLGFIDGIIGAE